jgi:hypothetical protein
MFSPNRGLPSRSVKPPHLVGQRCNGSTHKALSMRRLWLCLLLGVVLDAGTGTARAQDLSGYFPSGAAGYDQELGVTVQSRLHPEYEPLGIRVGGFMVYPSLDESTFYNSNVNGTPNSGSFGLHTSGVVSALSNWNRNNLDVSVGVDNYQFFSFPSERYTDWNVGAAGGYTIDDNPLTVGYYHDSYHQLGVGIATVQSETPVSDQVDSARIGYTFNFSRLAVSPVISFSAYQYGTATVLGEPVDLRSLDRNVVAASVTNRYSLSDEGGLLLVLQGFASRFPNQQPGQPTNDSNSFMLLGGFDYQSENVWRYRMLLGVEVREFESSQFPTHTAPVAEGSVTWQPTGLTTVTGSLSRLIEDPQSAETNGYVLTQGRIELAHELERNVIIGGTANIALVQYLQGSSQTNVSIGANVQWLINRNVRLTGGVSYSKQLGSNSSATADVPASLTSGAYSQTVILLALHIAL